MLLNSLTPKGTGLFSGSGRRSSSDDDMEETPVKAKGGNPWTAHVKDFAKKHKMSYWAALKQSDCRASYKK
jgi:hypothetical protein